MALNDSWWLKVKRAQKHMVEIRKEIKRYGDTHPYEVVRLQPPRKNPYRWRYVLRITKQPDPMLAVMIGDFVHNLRSALDHFVVGHVPASRRSSAYFPMVQTNIWAKDTNGHLFRRDRNARRSYKSATEGLSWLTAGIIKTSQPYHVIEWLGLHGAHGILNRLENADKHRDLIDLHIGMRLSVLTRIRYDLIHQMHDRKHFASDGATVVAFTAAPDLQESEVNVHVSAVPHISVKLPPFGGNGSAERYEAEHIMLDCLSYTRWILRLLEASATYEPAATYDIFKLLGTDLRDL